MFLLFLNQKIFCLSSSNNKILIILRIILKIDKYIRISVNIWVWITNNKKEILNNRKFD